MKYKTVGILGGSGFVGQHLSALLDSKGYQVRILSRKADKHPELSLIHGVSIESGDAFDPDVLKGFFTRVDVVINLIGILNEKKDNGREFHRIHVDMAHRIAMACETSSITRLLHMSALKADASKGSSYYLRSKGEAEDWIHHASELGLEVTSFRPSVIFGAQDRFLNRFGELLKLTPLVFPLACANSRFAPVYIGDVCRAFLVALDNPETIGQRYELCGPKTYTLGELVQFTATSLGLKRLVIGLPGFLSLLQARILGMLPTKPFTVDNYRSLQTESICTENGLPLLGIQPTSLESVAPQFLGNNSRKGNLNVYRKQRHYVCLGKHLR